MQLQGSTVKTVARRGAGAASTLLLCACLLLVWAFPAEGLVYLPDVTAEMAKASYWVEKQADPDVVLADRATIDALNQAGIDADGTGLQPLKTAACNFYTKTKQESIKAGAASSLASFIGNTYDSDGNLIDQDFVDAILANYPVDGSKPDIASQWAIVTTHTTMRAYPTDEMILDDAGDYDNDNLFVSMLRVNEPVAIREVSVDGRFYLCTSQFLGADWVPVEDVAICKDKEEWLAAWDIPEGQELVVWGNRVYTEDSRLFPSTANRMLYMGTVLERIDQTNAMILVGGRSIYDNYVCYLPVRAADGTYSKVPALINEAANVSAGYLPLTKANIARVAFQSLGQVYGWGGMLHANDCSGYVRDIYKCFGLELARNTTYQQNLPVVKYDLTGLDDAHKAAAIAQMPLGTTLFFPGHEMMYLGQENGKLFVISSLGTVGNLFGDSGINTIRSVTINTLDMVRKNRSTWLHNINAATLPYLPAEAKDIDVLDIEFYASSIDWGGTEHKETGKAVEPAVSIPGLVEGTDFEVTYADNVEVGTATATVTGKGAYSGSVSSTFEIVPAVELAQPVLTSATKSTAKGKVTAAWKKVAGANGYKLKIGATTYTVKSGSTLKKTVTATAGKTVKVSVRAYAKAIGKTYYSPWSSVKSIKVRQSVALKRAVLTSATKSSAKGKVTVGWESMPGVTGYRVKVGDQTYSVKGASNTKLTVSAPAGTTVKVKVRAYVSDTGGNYYGLWSDAKSVKVKGTTVSKTLRAG